MLAQRGVRALTRIMLVEDDPAIVESLQAYLRTEGFDTASADGAQE